MSNIPPELERPEHIKPPEFLDNDSYPVGRDLATKLKIGEYTPPIKPTKILNKLGEGMRNINGTPTPSQDIYGDLQY